MPYHSSPVRSFSHSTSTRRTNTHDTTEANTSTRKRKRDRWAQEPSYARSYDSRHRRSSSPSSRRRRSPSSSSCRRRRERRRYRGEERVSDRDRRNGRTFVRDGDRYRGNRAVHESGGDHRRANDRVKGTNTTSTSMQKKAAWEFTDSDTEGDTRKNHQRHREREVVETRERGGSLKRSSWTGGTRTSLGSKDERNGSFGRRSVANAVPVSMDEKVPALNLVLDLDIASPKKVESITRVNGPKDVKVRRNSCKAIQPDDVSKANDRPQLDAPERDCKAIKASDLKKANDRPEMGAPTRNSKAIKTNDVTRAHDRPETDAPIKAIKTDDAKKSSDRPEIDAPRVSQATASKNTRQRRHSEDTRGRPCDPEKPHRYLRRASMGTFAPSECPIELLGENADDHRNELDPTVDAPRDSGSPIEFRLVVDPPAPEIASEPSKESPSIPVEKTGGTNPSLEETPSPDDGSFGTVDDPNSNKCDVTAMRRRLQVRLMAALHTVNYTCQRIVFRSSVDPALPYDEDDVDDGNSIPVTSFSSSPDFSETDAASPFPDRNPDRVSSAFFSLVSNWDERPATASKMPPLLKVRFGNNPGSTEFPTQFQLLKARAEKAEGIFESAVAESCEFLRRFEKSKTRTEKPFDSTVTESELPNRFEMLKARAEKADGTEPSHCNAGFSETTDDTTPHTCTICAKPFKSKTKLDHHTGRCKGRKRVRDMETTFCICMVKPLEPILRRDDANESSREGRRYATVIEEWADSLDMTSSEEEQDEEGGFDPQVFCESCGFWLHIQCIGLELERLPEEYHCPRCSRETGLTRKRGKTRRESVPILRLPNCLKETVPRRKSDPDVVSLGRKTEAEVACLETDCFVPRSLFETERGQGSNSKEVALGRSEDVCRLSDVEVSSDDLTLESETEEEEGCHSGDEEGVCEADECSEKPVLVSIESDDDEEDDEEEEEEEETPERCFSDASAPGNDREDWCESLTEEEEEEEEEETHRKVEEVVGWMEIKNTDFVSSSSSSSSCSSSSSSRQAMQGTDWEPVEWNSDSIGCGRQRGHLGIGLYGKSLKHVSYFPKPSPIPGVLKADPVMGCIGLLGYAGGCVDLDRL